MAVDIDFHDMDEYVLVQLKGSSTMSDMVSAFMRIFSYSSTKKVSKMIVDCREVENSMPIEDIARISDKFNNIQKDYVETSQIKVTFAFLLNDQVYDPSHLQEDLPNMNELDTYVGTDLDIAAKWIMTR